MEVVEGAPLPDEELRGSDEVLGAWLDREPRFRVVRIQVLRSAGARQRLGRARRDRVSTAFDRFACDDVRTDEAPGWTRPTRNRKDASRRDCRHEPDQDLPGFSSRSPPSV